MKLPLASRPTYLAAAIAACLAASTIPSSALSFSTVAVVRQGDRSPDRDFNVTYDQILDYGPALNNSGRIAFGARLSNSKHDSAIVATGFVPDAFLFRQRNPAPDENGTFQGFEQFALNKAGEAGFVGDLNGTTGSYTQKGAFVSVSETNIIQVVRGGQTAPGGNGTISAFSVGTPVGGIAMNSLGEIAGRLRLTGTSGGSNDDVVIVRGDGGPLVALARKGQTLPGGLAIIELGAPSINDHSQVAFWARFTGGTTYGYYLHDGISLVEMARTDDPVPGGGQIFQFDNSTTPVNAAGHIVFSARTSSTTPDRVLVLATGSESTVIARTGTSAPGGGKFVDFTTFDTSTQPVSLNDRDAFAFSAKVTSGAANTYGLYTWNGSSLHRIAIKGLAAPGGTGNFNDFGRPAINSNGDVVFYSTLTGTSSTGIFFYEASSDSLHQVIRTGVAYVGGTLGTIRMLNLPSLGSPSNGFNDSGQVAFWYQLTNNGETGIALSTPSNLLPPTITVESTAFTPSDFTMTWSISNNAGTDIYRSSDLRNWGTPISTNNISDTFTDSPPPPGAAFYALVPSGQTFP